MKIKNTLRGFISEYAPGRWRSVWSGENPRPIFGSEREQARRRRQILKGQLWVDAANYFMAQDMEEQKKLIVLTDAPKPVGWLKQLKEKFAA